jgi:hypothetical protein
MKKPRKQRPFSPTLNPWFSTNTNGKASNWISALSVWHETHEKIDDSVNIRHVQRGREQHGLLD